MPKAIPPDDAPVDTQQEDAPVDTQLAKAVEKAVSQPPVVFNVYSEGVKTMLSAEADKLIRIVNDIDAEIARLTEKRTDAMLAYSGLSAARDKLNA